MPVQKRQERAGTIHGNHKALVTNERALLVGNETTKHRHTLEGPYTRYPYTSLVSTRRGILAEPILQLANFQTLHLCLLPCEAQIMR